MKLIAVDEVPKRAGRKKLTHIFDEFMRMNVKIVTYDFTSNEYKNAASAMANLSQAARRHGYPIYVVRRRDEIYFIRRDM